MAGQAYADSIEPAGCCAHAPGTSTSLTRNDAVGQASRLSLTSKSFRLSGFEEFRCGPLLGDRILTGWRQARRLSYATIAITQFFADVRLGRSRQID
jgi:hypothetical protein